jgi:hypothetical protein
MSGFIVTVSGLTKNYMRTCILQHISFQEDAGNDFLYLSYHLVTVNSCHFKTAFMKFLILLVSIFGIWLIYRKAGFNNPLIKYLSISLLIFQLIGVVEYVLVYFNIKAAGITIVSKEVILFFFTALLFYFISEHDTKAN